MKLTCWTTVSIFRRSTEAEYIFAERTTVSHPLQIASRRLRLVMFTVLPINARICCLKVRVCQRRVVCFLCDSKLDSVGASLERAFPSSNVVGLFENINSVMTI